LGVMGKTVKKKAKPKTKAGRWMDNALLAPKTAQIVPTDARQTMWSGVCYRCGDEVLGDTRKEAIELHKSHVKNDCRGK
jgi:hypothetical protein